MVLFYVRSSMKERLQQLHDSRGDCAFKTYFAALISIWPRKFKVQDILLISGLEDTRGNRNNVRNWMHQYFTFEKTGTPYNRYFTITNITDRNPVRGGGRRGPTKQEPTVPTELWKTALGH